MLYDHVYFVPKQPFPSFLPGRHHAGGAERPTARADQDFRPDGTTHGED